MKIELIIDKYCLSLKSYTEILTKLACEFSSDTVQMTSFEQDRQRLKELGINILPAWLVDNKVLRIDPGNYELIRKKILKESLCRLPPRQDGNNQDHEIQN